jgi:cytochrome P450
MQRERCPNASMQFGAGYMSCPGRHSAQMQLSKLLSTLFLDYEIELATPDQDWRISSSIIVRPYGWAVKAKRRQPIRNDRASPYPLFLPGSGGYKPDG